VFRNACVVIINMENMDEIEKIRIDGLNLNLAENESETRAKTSLKMHYEAQSAVIERQLEGLEGVRSKLGLSQRKMAQLLMVDPSAWTRWNRPGVKVPGVVWRALQWYMIVQEKIPGLTPNYFLGVSPQVLKAEAMKEIRKESLAREELAEKVAKFESKIQGFRAENDQLILQVFSLEQKVRLWRVGTIIMTLTLIFSVFFWFMWTRKDMLQ
jgi:hypothetical protein